MRHNNSEKENVFFWAMEWNKNVRLVGLIRDPLEKSNIEYDLPELEWAGGPGQRYRIETPLEKENDILFKENLIKGP